MPQNGVIFSDGVEEDRLEFNSGATAKIQISDRTLRLVVPANHGSETGTTAPGQWSGNSRVTRPVPLAHGADPLEMSKPQVGDLRAAEFSGS